MYKQYKVSLAGILIGTYTGENEDHVITNCKHELQVMRRWSAEFQKHDKDKKWTTEEVHSY